MSPVSSAISNQHLGPQGQYGIGTRRYDDSDYAVKLSRSVPVLTDEPR
jgi:hypothetical protein